MLILIDLMNKLELNSGYIFSSLHLPRFCCSRWCKGSRCKLWSDTSGGDESWGKPEGNDK